MGREKLEIHESDLQKIEELSSKGLRKEVIANYLGLSLSTFERREKENELISMALRIGKSKAIEQVSETAFQMAVSGKHPNMTIFWLKVHAGLIEKDTNEETQTSIKFCYSIPGNRYDVLS